MDARTKRIHELTHIINAKDKRIREILGLPPDLLSEPSSQVKFVSDAELKEALNCKKERDTAEEELIRLLRKEL